MSDPAHWIVEEAKEVKIDIHSYVERGARLGEVRDARQNGSPLRFSTCRDRYISNRDLVAMLIDGR